jgi:hypothetical protein
VLSLKGRFTTEHCGNCKIKRKAKEIRTSHNCDSVRMESSHAQKYERSPNARFAGLLETYLVGIRYGKCAQCMRLRQDAISCKCHFVRLCRGTFQDCCGAIYYSYTALQQSIKGPSDIKNPINFNLVNSATGLWYNSDTGPWYQNICIHVQTVSEPFARCSSTFHDCTNSVLCFALHAIWTHAWLIRSTYHLLV